MALTFLSIVLKAVITVLHGVVELAFIDFTFLILHRDIALIRRRIIIRLLLVFNIVQVSGVFLRRARDIAGNIVQILRGRFMGFLAFVEAVLLLLVLFVT